MNFAALLSAIGFAAIKNEAQAAARKMSRRFAFGIAVGILALTAVGFAVAAFTVWLAGELGVIEALLIVAGIMLVLAVIVQLVGSALDRRGRPAARIIYRAAPPPPPPMAPLAEAGAEEAVPPGSELGAMAVVAVVGFVLARTLFRRR
jgi:hypothetical protein